MRMPGFGRDRAATKAVGCKVSKGRVRCPEPDPENHGVRLLWGQSKLAMTPRHCQSVQCIICFVTPIDFPGKIVVHNACVWIEPAQAYASPQSTC